MPIRQKSGRMLGFVQTNKLNYLWNGVSRGGRPVVFNPRHHGQKSNQVEADHAPPLRKALRDMKFGVLGCGCYGLQLKPRHVLPEVGRNGVFRGGGVRMRMPTENSIQHH